jgi:tripeptide aminopeptidase
MINAIKIAADFIHLLPRDRLSPETTDGEEGFIHPYVVQASVERTSVRLIVRDFRTPGLKAKQQLIEQTARQALSYHPGARVAFDVQEQYRNMKEVLEADPQVIEYAREAVRRAGLTVHERRIRGGTDGSRLSFMGLPTPNLFAGEHNFHSRLEWVSVQDMEKAVEVIVNLCKIWEERS